MICTFEVGYCTVTFCERSPREQSVVGPNPTQGKLFFLVQLSCLLLICLNSRDFKIVHFNCFALNVFIVTRFHYVPCNNTTQILYQGHYEIAKFHPRHATTEEDATFTNQLTSTSVSSSGSPRSVPPSPSPPPSSPITMPTSCGLSLPDINSFNVYCT